MPFKKLKTPKGEFDIPTNWLGEKLQLKVYGTGQYPYDFADVIILDNQE